MSTELELLAPAGNLEIGKAAIDHGADALYIGAPQFSARAQAGQAIAEIEELIQYAHFFHARVYVALNTILQDKEVEQALEIIRSVDSIGADALIIQDLGLLELDLPPIPLFASTQMHNTTPEKVKFLEEVGFQRVILARELSLEEIAAIHDKTSVDLEVFVHGALCVSYSGQCYMSQFASGRSANRGVCSQPCRHPYTLTDGNGKIIKSDKHLISLKDMNRVDSIADLVAAGTTSFKIEGRYKEIDYVKNVTAAYRSALDSFIDQNPTYHRASSGSCSFSFQPDTEKTFNRGYTSYYLRSEREKPASLNTPKSMGQFLGKIESIGKDFFASVIMIYKTEMDSVFFPKKELGGMSREPGESGKIYPNSMKDLTVGTSIFRNLNTAFSRALKHSSHCRTIAVDIEFRQEEKGIRMVMRDEDEMSVEYWQDAQYEPARDPIRARANIETQLSRTGDTPYRIDNVKISPEQPGFIPLSLLNDMRRKALAMLTRKRKEQYQRLTLSITPNAVPYPDEVLDYRANVSNSYAEKFYRRHGVKIKERAWELLPDLSKKELSQRSVMVTRYCILNQLDACPKAKQGKRATNFKQPLRIHDRGNSYRLEFNCRDCQMLIFPEEKTRQGPKNI